MKKTMVISVIVSLSFLVIGCTSVKDLAGSFQQAREQDRVAQISKGVQPIAGTKAGAFNGIAEIRCTDERKQYGVTFTPEKGSLILRMYDTAGKLLLTKQGEKESDGYFWFKEFDGVNTMKVKSDTDNGNPVIIGDFTENTCPNRQIGFLEARLPQGSNADTNLGD
jgi:flagellar hook assembly protein FlgD